MVRDADVNPRGTILFKSTQLLTYGHWDVHAAYIQIWQAVRNLGLHINEGKTKYMAATSKLKTKATTTSNLWLWTIKIGEYNFEIIDKFLLSRVESRLKEPISA